MENQVTINGKTLHFAEREAKIIRFLFDAGGKVRTKRALLSHMQVASDADRKILDVYICKIRSKLETIDLGKQIRTVWGRGYAWGFPQENPKPFNGIDLPPANTDHWVVSKKYKIIVALEQGLTDRSEILSYYPDLSEEELQEWVEAYGKSGYHGLKITRRV